jgi:hypothetical protein
MNDGFINGNCFFSSRESRMETIARAIIPGVLDLAATISPLQSFDIPAALGGPSQCQHVTQTDRGVSFSFEKLAMETWGGGLPRRHRSAIDFPVIALKGIALLTFCSNDNRARRFITLVDELYEGKCAPRAVPKDVHIADPDEL